MVTQVSKDERTKAVNDFSQFTIILNHVRVISFYQSFPGPVIGMDGELAQND
jgi:hypothetical protein